MKRFIDKINIARNHILANDINLGYRFTIDCALDTNESIYLDQIIAFAPLSELPDKSILRDKCLDLLLQMEGGNFKFSTDNSLLLQSDGVGKMYKNFELKPVTLSINKGDVWGLVGENGNGKTTLLRILAADLQNTSGAVSYPFHKSSSQYKLRTELVYIPQRTPRYFGSIKSNLKFTASQYGIRGEQNERMVMIYIIRFGLWAFRDMDWSELSSGYKMRFELANTFLRKPKILLLDEPLANLDILTQQIVLEDLKNLSQSLNNPLGIILSSQQLFEVEKIANNILFLKKGEPTDLNSFNTIESDNLLFIEMELDCTKSELQAILEPFGIIELEYNGGTFSIQLQNATIKQVVNAICDNNLELMYFRNISKSSRRLFTH